MSNIDFASNLGESLGDTILSIVIAIQPIFYVVGTLFLAIAIWKLFISHSPQQSTEDRFWAGVINFVMAIIFLFMKDILELLFDSHSS